MSPRVMTDLSALIVALEGATGPSRELDAKIACAVTFKHLRPAKPDDFGGQYGYSPGNIKCKDGFLMADFYTSSIDAALTLVPEGWVWGRMRNLKSREDGVRRFHVRLSKPVPGSTSPKDGARQGAKHQLLAIALATACLKARQASSTPSDQSPAEKE